MLHDRAPEEYPLNLGLTKPEFLRENLDLGSLVNQAETSYKLFGYVAVMCFWGVGWKKEATNIDRLSFAHLTFLVAHLQREFRKGTRLHLVITDNHAIANEIPQESQSGYINDIEMLAREFSLSTRRLSSICSLSNDEILALKPTDGEAVTYGQHRRRFEGSALSLNAQNHEERAERYFVLRMREKVELEKKFSEYIYLCFESGERSFLRPSLPHLRTYALPSRKWRKHKPWFTNY